MLRMKTYHALEMAVTKQQLRSYQRANQSSYLGRRGWLWVVVIVSTVFAALRVWAIEPALELLPVVFLWNISGALLVGLLVWWIGCLLQDKSTERRIRFGQFADDNNLQYLPAEVAPHFSGIIFNTGSQRRLFERFLADEFEIGNYRYTVRHGKSSTTYQYGYIRIALERHVAHMLLDAKSNNMNIFGVNMSNLPVAINHNQTLSLEGDFDKYFTLYAPKEYERDAFYIFTPDLMALLIDEAAEFDVEVIDDQLFVYGKKFNLASQDTWQRLSAIISTVGEKTISRTDFYADENIGDRSKDIVAEPGRRLRQEVPWYIIVAIILWMLGYVLQIIMSR